MTRLPAPQYLMAIAHSRKFLGIAARSAWRLCGLLFTYQVLLIATACADQQELCVYVMEDGRAIQTTRRSAVPVKYRDGAKCLSPKGTSADVRLALPSEIDLEGTVRRESVITPVGPMRVRWPRKIEMLFGRTPQRALVEAGTALRRALVGAGFPPELQSLRLDWEVVFMDEDLPEQQIPFSLITNCNPAWMTPPANIYVVGQRAAKGCGASSDRVDTKLTDAGLTRILLHEMGHAIEHQLLKEQFGSDRARAEGFACWFEQYAADFSSLIPRGSTRSMYRGFARQALEQQVFRQGFGGTALDYAWAAMPFVYLEEKRGVRGVMQVYELLQQRVPLVEALARVSGKSQERLGKEIVQLLQ